MVYEEYKGKMQREDVKERLSEGNQLSRQVLGRVVR